MEAAFLATTQIGGETFQVFISSETQGKVLAAGWENRKHHVMALQTLADKLGILLPAFLDFRVDLERICIRYSENPSLLLLNIAANNQWKMVLGANLSNEVFYFYLKPAMEVNLNKLPFIGKYLGDTSYLRLNYLNMIYKKNAKDHQIKIHYQLESKLSEYEFTFGSYKQEIPENLKEMQTKFIESEQSAEQPSQEEKDGWKTIKKKLGPCFIRRVKASFKDGNIVVAMDAGITISILTLDFLELQVQIALGKSFKPTFSLNGLCVAVAKPPLYLSGGLLYEREKDQYTGELTIRYQQMTFLGMGLYQEATQTRASSFFASLFMGYAFGGPPCFYVTGLAAGFGMNRRIKIPEIDKVPEFPLIKAMQSKSGKQDVGGMLSSLDSYIVSSEGNHFLTAGIRFTSFGMVESIVLLNVEFGQKFEVSLLGTAQMDLPPKSQHPIVHGVLALKAVFCPEDGILQIEGALMRDAYLFSKDCHITGGFALYSWFSGEHAGEFVLTVGGYHPSFKKKAYYPNANRVGINWKISNELNLSGEAYFALVPSCLMAGGKLNLDYHMGKLKAWCHVGADFLIQWNPFYYDISAYANIGASYRLDALFIHHTFTLELSASMHLWGPEFAGEIRIKWFIISFTIRFNTNSKKGAPPIDWNGFQERFLDNKGGAMKLDKEQGYSCVKVNIKKGQLGDPNTTNCYIDASDGIIQIESQFPCSEIVINEKDQSTRKKENMNQSVGIVPMGMRNLKTELYLNLKKATDHGEWEYVEAKGEKVLMDMPSALWDPEQSSIDKIDMNKGMMPNMLKGYCLIAENTYGDCLPKQSKDWYSMETLLENERVICDSHPAWHKVQNVWEKELEEIDYKKMEKNDTRDAWLLQLSESYDVYKPEKIDVQHFTEHVEELLNAPFLSKKL